jgi:hypothetical protein
MHGIRSLLFAACVGWMTLAAAVVPVRPPKTIAAHAVNDARDDLLGAIGQHRLVLLGEMHGTQETPALVGNLLDAYAARRHPVILALEVSTQEQPRFDRYMASRDTAADRAALLAGGHWRERHHDGRDSRAMFDLIAHAQRLHAGGAPVSLLAFDAGGEDRNRGMADCLRAALSRRPDATVLVLTGNVHAMTRRPPWTMLDEQGHPIEPPMTAGRYLADLAPLSVDVQAAHGAYWACRADGCRVQAVRPHGARGLSRNGEDSAWDFELVLPRFTPSPPAIAMTTAARAVGP